MDRPVGGMLRGYAHFSKWYYRIVTWILHLPASLIKVRVSCTAPIVFRGVNAWFVCVDSCVPERTPSGSSGRPRLCRGVLAVGALLARLGREQDQLQVSAHFSKAYVVRVLIQDVSSHICSRLASQGKVVLAFEHRDGSGPYVETRSAVPGKQAEKHPDYRLYLHPEDVS